MIPTATGNDIIRTNVPEYTTDERISLRNVGWTPLGGRIKIKQNPTPHERIIYVLRDKSLGTDSGRGVRVMTPDINQDICFDDVVGALLKDITEKFRGPLKQKIIDNIKYTESMETVLLSESSLAKEWLTDEEDEAWKDL